MLENEVHREIMLDSDLKMQNLLMPSFESRVENQSFGQLIKLLLMKVENC